MIHSPLPLIGAALVFVLACPSKAMSQAPAAAAPVAESGDYRIQVGDQLDIKFFYNPTLNEQVVVRPDGRFTLQLIQEVAAAGRTPAALTQELTERYAADLRQPEVTVIVRSFGGQRLFVDGEVSRPGMFPIVGVTTVLEAIAQAGGLKWTARDSRSSSFAAERAIRRSCCRSI